MASLDDSSRAFPEQEIELLLVTNEDENVDMMNQGGQEDTVMKAACSVLVVCMLRIG